MQWDITMTMRTCYFWYFGHDWLWPPKRMVSACQKLWCLSSYYKSNISLISFLKYCQSIANLFLLGTWGMNDYVHTKLITAVCGKVWCISVGKKPTYLFLVSWYIAFILQICNFGYFHYICWRPINRMVSTCKKLYTCRKHVYLHAKNNLIPLLFLKILHFKESYNLIG